MQEKVSYFRERHNGLQAVEEPGENKELVNVISATGLRGNEVKILMDTIRSFPNLHTINLSHSSGVAANIYELIYSIPEPSLLQVLILQNVSLSDESAKAIANILWMLPNLHTLHLNNNYITDKGEEHLARGLSSCFEMIEVNIVGNSGTRKGTKAIKDVTDTFPHFEELNADYYVNGEVLPGARGRHTYHIQEDEACDQSSQYMGEDGNTFTEIN